MVQTILGSNGQIARELAIELKKHYTDDIRLVSRDPQQINPSDALFKADLLDASQTIDAVSGSEIVYFTAGLPVDSQTWASQFSPMVKNVIEACRKHHAKLVFFDNTYMYPQDDRLLTEETEFAPVGIKGRARSQAAMMVLDEIRNARLQAVICRAPEFYGPGRTQSITNRLLFERIRNQQRPMVLLRDDKLRTLIWTPDASRSTALIGNTPDAYHQTWHLPCDDHRLTYAQFIALISELSGEKLPFSVVGKTTLKLAALFKKELKEIMELLPRYEHNNLFDSTKFKRKFPDFATTSYRDGITQILAEQRSSSR
jgi:NAD dependent epimerase/dehydratase family.